VSAATESSNGNGYGSGTGEVRRWPVAVVLVALLVTAIIVGNGTGGSSSATVRRSADDPAAMPARSARSAAWYCPGPPPSPANSKSREHVFVSNLGAAPVDVALTVLRDKQPAVRRTMRVAARTTAEAAPQDRADRSAIIVEPFGAKVAVESTNLGPDALASTPCATQPASTWHFASGTTVRGVQQWVVLFNPFGDDAVVDMSFFTEDGFEQPGDLQALTVPRHSRIAVPVDQYVRRQRSVATTIVARAGRIVAQQTLLFTPDSNRSGETRSLGAVGAADDWVFPSGRVAAGATRTLAISNPGDLDGEADVSIASTDDVVIEPVTVRIPRRSVANVQLGACGRLQPPACIQVPPNLSYYAVVRATVGQPIVVEDLSTYTEGRFTGATASAGSRTPAKQWVFVRSRVSGELDAGLDILTTANSTAHASIAFVLKGKELRPSDLQNIELRPGTRVSVPLASRPTTRSSPSAPSCGPTISRANSASRPATRRTTRRAAAPVPSPGSPLRRSSSRRRRGGHAP
jgi:uncharacterized protein DUF5719